jgi:fimbrial chaperone protein
VRAIAASLLGVLAAAGTAAASTLSVAPVRIELSPTASTAVLTVRNQEDSAVIVQARPAAWSQAGDHDQLDDTRDLLVSPPLFTIPPRGQQTLRIALLRKPDAARELDYRVVLSEVPPMAAADSPAVRIALRITLPVFVAAQAHATPELAWEHDWLPDGRLQVHAHNGGSAHIQILDFDVQSADHGGERVHADTAHYVLPGNGASWELHAATFSRASGLVIHGHSDRGDFTVTSAPAGSQ